MFQELKGTIAESWWEHASAGEFLVTGAITNHALDVLTLALSHLSPETQLSFLIKSGGGDASTGLALFDIIRAWPAKTIGVGMGAVGSAALDILCACDVRAAYPHTYFTTHMPQVGTDGEYHTPAEAKAGSDFANLLVEHTIDVLSVGNRGTRDEIRAFLNQEENFGVDTAYDLGILNATTMPTVPFCIGG